MTQAAKSVWAKLASELDLEKLAAWLMQQRWYGGKGQSLAAGRFVDVVPLSTDAALGLLRVTDGLGNESRYCLPLVQCEASDQRCVAALLDPESQQCVADLPGDERFSEPLLNLLARQGAVASSSGRLVAKSSETFRGVVPRGRAWRVQALAVEQSNSALVIEDKFFLKLYRRVEPGLNPDAEIIAALTRQNFAHVPNLVASLDYVAENGETTTLAIAQELVPSAQGMWEFTLSQVAEVLTGNAHTWSATEVARAALLGRRTAELHVALASIPGPAFSPEVCAPDAVQEVARLVVREAETFLPTSSRGERGSLIAKLKAFATAVCKDATATFGQCIRCHGDYHLGQVLWSQGDVKILDFEGEPARPLAQRRAKASPLKDVAGMLRSFDYARHVALRELPENLRSQPSVREVAAAWQSAVQQAYVASYRSTPGIDAIVPGGAAFDTLLSVYLVEKAAYELRYEINNRPSWVDIPRAALDEYLAKY
jgi:trehalose synthase-fused probable maltokinase